MPLMLDIDKTKSGEHMEEMILDRFVAVQLSMVSRTPHNKEKGQYLGTKSNGIGEATAFKELCIPARSILTTFATTKSSCFWSVSVPQRTSLIFCRCPPPLKGSMPSADDKGLAVQNKTEGTLAIISCGDTLDTPTR